MSAPRVLTEDQLRVQLIVALDSGLVSPDTAWAILHRWDDSAPVCLEDRTANETYLYDRHGIRIVPCYKRETHDWHGWVAGNDDLRCPGVQQRITHGRHCTCSACAREHWQLIRSPCGMHGSGCPAVYAPLGSARSGGVTGCVRAREGAPKAAKSGGSGVGSDGGL